MAISIIVDSKKVETWLRKIPKNVRKRGQQGLNQFGDILVHRLLQQAKVVGLRQFRTNRSMFTSTRYQQKGSTGAVIMPMSGIYQDRARPHFVSINKTKPMLRAWAGRYGYRASVLWFTPKPYFNQGINNAMKSLMPTMRPQIKAAIKESRQ